MDIWTCIIVAGIAFFIGFGCGGVIEILLSRIKEEIECLQDKEEELKELEARIAEMQGENPVAPFDDE